MRSATRKEQEGGTCATRVTRGTIDFPARDNLELRDKEFARKFQVRSTQSSFQAKVSPTRHTRSIPQLRLVQRALRNEE